MTHTTNKQFLGINFGFEDQKFYVEYASCSREVGNLREEFDKRAIELYNSRSKLMLGLSSGLDSQAVMHSFFSQGISIDCAFLYHPGYNEYEYNNLKILEKKYGFNALIIDIDPLKCKEEVMSLHQELNLHPYQIIHRKFLSMLPEDYDIVQGVHGPDLYYVNNKWYSVETANSFELSRLRAFQTVSNRTGEVIGWERTSEIMLSLLSDNVLTSFMYAYPYISQNKLMYNDGTKIPVIDHWDLYIKPFIYGKYWKDELEYFAKYQGPEGIDYIINGPMIEYKKNLIAIPYNTLVSHLGSKSSEVKRFYQRPDNT
jgi:hypothetical protein